MSAAAWPRPCGASHPPVPLSAGRSGRESDDGPPPASSRRDLSFRFRRPDGRANFSVPPVWPPGTSTGPAPPGSYLPWLSPWKRKCRELPWYGPSPSYPVHPPDSEAVRATARHRRQCQWHSAPRRAPSPLRSFPCPDTSPDESVPGSG